MSDLNEGYLQSIDRCGLCWSDQLPWSEDDDDAFIVSEFNFRICDIRHAVKIRNDPGKCSAGSEEREAIDMLLRATIMNLKAKLKSWEPSKRVRRLAH
jgi:hypothetical protein